MQEVKLDFDKLFMEAVDDSLSVLSISGREMFFFHLERSSSIRKHDIPKQPESFIVALERIFGAGAWVLEKLILKNLYSKLGLEFRERKDYTFKDYLKDAIATLNEEHTKEEGLQETVEKSLALGMKSRLPHQKGH